MEAIINLGEEKVRLRANALTAHHYKNQFKSDILKDTFDALGGIGAILELQDLQKRNDYKKMQALINKIDTVLIHQLVWAFAKTVDIHIDPFYDWLSKVDLPPVTDLLLEDGFVDLLVGNIHRKKYLGLMLIVHQMMTY